MAALDVLVRQLQANGRIVRGSVSSAAAVVAGTGFTAVKNATGNYTVTFTVAFRGVPSVVCSCRRSGGVSVRHDTTDPSVSAFRVQVVDASGGAIDGGFDFVAAGS